MGIIFAADRRVCLSVSVLVPHLSVMMDLSTLLVGGSAVALIGYVASAFVYSFLGLLKHHQFEVCEFPNGVHRHVVIDDVSDQEKTSLNEAPASLLVMLVLIEVFEGWVVYHHSKMYDSTRKEFILHEQEKQHKRIHVEWGKKFDVYKSPALVSLKATYQKYFQLANKLGFGTAYTFLMETTFTQLHLKDLQHLNHSRLRNLYLWHLFEEHEHNMECTYWYANAHPSALVRFVRLIVPTFWLWLGRTIFSYYTILLENERKPMGKFALYTKVLKSCLDPVRNWQEMASAFEALITMAFAMYPKREWHQKYHAGWDTRLKSFGLDMADPTVHL